MTRALVLGGGGVTGIAWELGMLEGLRRGGVALGDADTIIGTSAGSVVGVRVARDEVPLGYDNQLRPPDGELAAGLGPRTTAHLVALMLSPGGESRRWRRIGAAARKAAPGPADARIAVIRDRIGDGDWPDRDLRITAVDVDRGAFTVFDRSSGVRLVEACAASCAVPLVWPPVPIGGTTYVDGGMRSVTNADLAAGADRVIVLAPQTATPHRAHRIDRQLARTGAGTTLLVHPDSVARHAMGANSLDPAQRAAAALAGLRQAGSVIDRVKAAWD